MTRSRLQNVLEHLEDHPDQLLSLDELSQLAGLSRYHFHRLFQARFDISDHGVVERTIPDGRLRGAPSRGPRRHPRTRPAVPLRNLNRRINALSTDGEGY